MWYKSSSPHEIFKISFSEYQEWYILWFYLWLFVVDWGEKSRFITNFIKVIIKSEYKYKNDENGWDDVIVIRFSKI